MEFYGKGKFEMVVVIVLLFDLEQVLLQIWKLLKPLKIQMLQSVRCRSKQVLNVLGKQVSTASTGLFLRETQDAVAKRP